jgi:hypothetical protein
MVAMLELGTSWNCFQLFRGYSYQHSCGKSNQPTFWGQVLQTICGDDLGMFTSMNHGGWNPTIKN